MQIAALTFHSRNPRNEICRTRWRMRHRSILRLFLVQFALLSLLLSLNSLSAIAQERMPYVGQAPEDLSRLRRSLAPALVTVLRERGALLRTFDFDGWTLTIDVSKEALTRVGQAARDFKTDDVTFKKLIESATKKK
jgi:hypothetical protein